MNFNEIIEAGITAIVIIIIAVVLIYVGLELI
jgi:hypothetical protein